MLKRQSRVLLVMCLSISSNSCCLLKWSQVIIDEISCPYFPFNWPPQTLLFAHHLGVSSSLVFYIRNLLLHNTVKSALMAREMLVTHCKTRNIQLIIKVMASINHNASKNFFPSHSLHQNSMIPEIYTAILA